MTITFTITPFILKIGWVICFILLLMFTFIGVMRYSDGE